MKKCLPITLLVSLLCFGAGCTPKNSSSTGGNTPTSSSVAPQVTVSSVEIEYDGETTVLAGSTAKLSAEAKMSDGSKGKVVWSTSDENVAKVTNGTVAFKNVLEDATVTITATSKDDSSKSASVTFEVKFTAINFANSRGNFDSSLYLEENSVIVEKGDSALLFNEVHGTKWYVEADVTPSTDLGTETDQYPKFGIMTGSDANGYWNTECKNVFYFVDAQNPATTGSWTALGFVGQNDTHSDWNWGGVQGASVSAENKFAKEETTKMGLMRDGIHYYLFAGRGDGYGVVKHIVNETFAADEATYAWFGGWQTAYTLSNPTYLIGDEVDSKYEAVSTITLGSYEQTLYINDTYQLDYKVDTDMYNPSKLTFTSSNTDVATVSQTGLITAGGAAGTATITVAYEDVKAEFALEVTEDAMFKVELNGQMDDLLWTDTVKGNVYKHYSTHEAHETQIDVYASRNSKGIYFYADYSSKVDGSAATNWWQGNNIEMRLYSPSGMLTNDKEIGSGNDNQYWISYYNNSAQSNTNGVFITAPEYNEETGRYSQSFEFFISYAKAGIDKNTPVAFCMGANPCGSYWWNDAAWYTNFETCYKVTANGIVRYLPESDCVEHNYVCEHTTPVSCKADGLDTYTCKYCQHSYTEVVPATGEHNYANETARTNATCHSEGSVTRQCTGCDLTENETLPVDPFAHDGECTDGVWACCNKAGRNNRWESGGWGGSDAGLDTSNWTYVQNSLAGDFEVTVTFTMETNGIVGNWWRGVLPVVQHDIESGKGSAWVTRFDWWGWCDPWESGENLIAEWSRDEWWSNDAGENVTEAQFLGSMTKSTITWKCVRTGTEIVNTFTIASAEGTFTYWSKGTGIAETKNVNLALSAEFARYAVLDVVKA